MGQAWGTCTDLLRFGSLITTNPPGVIGYAAGVGILNYGFDEAERLLREDSPDENRLRGLLDQLNRIAPLESRVGQRHQGRVPVHQYRDRRELPQDSPRRSLLAGYMFQPERTRDSFAGFCRMEIANISLPYAEMSLPGASPVFPRDLTGSNSCCDPTAWPAEYCLHGLSQRLSAEDMQCQGLSGRSATGCCVPAVRDPPWSVAGVTGDACAGVSPRGAVRSIRRQAVSIPA